MPYSEREYWIWLTIAFGPANARKWNAYSHYRSISEAYEKISSGDMMHVLPQDVKTVRSASMSQANKLIDFCESKDIGICTYGDPDFPQRLKEIYNPPSVLFYKGDITGIDESIVISVVGTRKPSKYSIAVSKKICSELADQGVVIASGFAVGLDSVAHGSAINSGGKTIAVLPCGLLYDYPSENAEYKDLVAKNGALISEYFPADKPTPLSFRARNRVLSGLSLGTLILQAGIKSGALSTASFALSQGRDIFCIPPHELYNDEYAGVSGLIRDGAIPVFDSSDIINEYTGIYPHKLKSERVKPVVASDEKPDKKASANPVQKLKPAVKEAEEPIRRFRSALTPPDEFNGTKKLIYDYIKENGETHLDQIAVGIGDVHELEAYLTELELDGLIRSLPGNLFSI